MKKLYYRREPTVEQLKRSFQLFLEPSERERVRERDEEREEKKTEEDEEKD